MHDLRWADVAPSTHVLDIALVDDALAAIVRGGTPTTRQRVAEDVHRLFVEAFGSWAAMWSWSANDGGPVRHYCCVNHSIFPDRERDRRPGRDTQSATLQRIRDAMLDAHAYLVELESLFDEVHAAHLSPARALERAAPRIYDLVAARTHAEDAWYQTFESAVAWFAETVVYDVEAARRLVDATVTGTFQSWLEPTAEQRTRVFTELVGVAAADEVDDVIDGLAAWQAIRATAFAALPPLVPRRRVITDGHERFIAESDQRRDPARARRMSAALVLCRDAARHGLSLAFDGLAEWQALVLGASAPVEFRATAAHAKRGRERYPFDDITALAFDDALADANDRDTPVAVRAARVYLDVCFFHPFPDGNARAARLALDHVLAREGLALHDARGIFTLSRAAGDARAAWSLAAAIDRVAGPR